MPSKELIALVAEAIIDNPPVETVTDDEIILDWSPTAKAAISTILAALQEPTEGMREAGIEAIDDNWERGVMRPAANSSVNCWTAMLAASALGEQSDRTEIVSGDGAVWDETAPNSQVFQRREQSE
ncbi:MULTISPECIES: hypothetical protein [Brucella]|uniref:hypothetical protein n=1 Tax=Brucella TaxID=234 RepID=UPI0002883A7B|nr:hypothetical protein [Brucella anthropi]